MARQGKTPNLNTIPLAPPSSVSKRAPSKPLIEISEEEQWRLINESGILKRESSQSQQSTGSDPERDGELSPFTEEIFNATLLIIPFSGILLLMEILIRQQYGKETSMEDVMDRMLPGVPILSLLVFYTLRYKSYRRFQTLLFLASVAVGSRMLWLLNRASWLVNMKQCPPLATVWIFTVLQLDLELAVGNLIAVGIFVWWKNLKVLL